MKYAAILYTIISFFSFSIIQAQTMAWQGVGDPIDGSLPGSFFGQSLSLSADGKVLAVGGPVDQGTGFVQVFDWQNDSWEQRGEDITGALPFNGFGRVLSIDNAGNRIIVGAFRDSTLAPQGGLAGVYEWDGSVWQPMGDSFLGDAERARLGRAVAISGDGQTIVIGSSGSSIGDLPFGLVQVYTWQGGEWVQKGEDLEGEAEGDLFGMDVDINRDGSVIAVGAPFNDGGGFNAGHARVFEWNENAWVQRGESIEGTAENDWQSLVRLNDAGDRLAVSSFVKDVLQENDGQVRVFDWNGVEWVQLGNNLVGERPNTQLGFSLDFSAGGDTMIVGANLDSVNAPAQGSARVLVWQDNMWQQIGQLLVGEAAEDQFSSAVAMGHNGRRIAVGAYLHDAGGEDAGRVRVYEWPIATSLYSPFVTNMRLSLYPNPVRDEAILEVEDSGKGLRLALWDGRGKRLWSKWWSGGRRMSLEFGGLPAGVYYLQVFEGEELVQVLSVVRGK